MNSKRLFPFLFVVLLASLLLSACAGGGVTNSWPGITVVDETVYFANGQNVFAINAVDGKELWRFPTQAIRSAYFYAPPAVGADGRIYAGGYHKIFYALNEGGQQAWEFDQAKNSYFGSALVDNGIVYAPNGDDNLYALDASGQKLWTFEAKHGLWAKPIMTDQCLIQSSMDHHVYCLDKENGDVLWESEDLGGAVVTAPEIGPNGELFVGTFNSEVVGLNGNNGEIINRFKAGGWVWSSPLLDAGNLYFGDLNGNFYAIDAATFEKKWEIQPDTADKRQIIGKPLIMDGQIFFGTETGNFYTVNPTDGKVINTRTIGGKIFADPVAAGNLILVAPNGAEASLIALDGKGNQQWSFVPVK
jgi:eukaryotic-like serine/threonine-protein kinase